MCLDMSTLGTSFLLEQMPKDGMCVARLRAAGAIIIGTLIHIHTYEHTHTNLYSSLLLCVLYCCCVTN